VINGKKKYKILLDDWDNDLDPYLSNTTKLWDLEPKGSSDAYDQNCIWNNTINDYFKEDWYEVMSNGPRIPVNDYYWTVYPAVAIGDLVEVRETAVISVITKIGDSGMGDTVYEICSMEGDTSWVQRPQLRKIL